MKRGKKVLWKDINPIWGAMVTLIIFILIAISI